MNKLIIKAMREGYSTDQIKCTMTVLDLKAHLEEYDDETPIYSSFDNGYTYGGIRESEFEEVEE